MHFQRFAAASALTMAVGGVLLGAAPAMAAEGHPKPPNQTIKANKKYDNDKFTNVSKQYCIGVWAPVIIDSRVDDTNNTINCVHRPVQENEGDEPEIGAG